MKYKQARHWLPTWIWQSCGAIGIQPQTQTFSEPPGPTFQFVATGKAPWKGAWDALASARACSYEPKGRSPDPSEPQFPWLGSEGQQEPNIAQDI